MTETDIKTYKPLTVRIAASEKPGAPVLIVSAETPQELELNLLAIEENTTGATIGRLEEVIRAQYNLGSGLGARGVEAPRNPEPAAAPAAPQQGFPAAQQAPAAHAEQQAFPAQQAPQQAAQGFPAAQPQQGFPAAAQQGFPAPQEQAQQPQGFPAAQGFPAQQQAPAPQAQQQGFSAPQAQGFPAPQQQASEPAQAPDGSLQFPQGGTDPNWGNQFPSTQQAPQQQAPAPQQQQQAPAPQQGGGFLAQEPPTPGAPMLAGVGPAKIVKSQDPNKQWAAWADPRPREVTDLIAAKTDDPNDPRLAAGQAKFWAFIQTRR